FSPVNSQIEAAIAEGALHGLVGGMNAVAGQGTGDQLAQSDILAFCMFQGIVGSNGIGKMQIDDARRLGHSAATGQADIDRQAGCGQFLAGGVKTYIALITAGDANAYGRFVNNGKALLLLVDPIKQPCFTVPPATFGTECNISLQQREGLVHGCPVALIKAAQAVAYAWDD